MNDGGIGESVGRSAKRSLWISRWILNFLGSDVMIGFVLRCTGLYFFLDWILIAEASVGVTIGMGEGEKVERRCETEEGG